MNITYKFGLRIKSLREAKGWSQEDLAEHSGLHRTYISGIERGTRNPTLEVIDCFAQTFHMSLKELFNFN